MTKMMFGGLLFVLMACSASRGDTIEYALVEQSTITSTYTAAFVAQSVGWASSSADFSNYPYEAGDVNAALSLFALLEPTTPQQAVWTYLTGDQFISLLIFSTDHPADPFPQYLFQPFPQAVPDPPPVSSPEPSSLLLLGLALPLLARRKVMQT